LLIGAASTASFSYMGFLCCYGLSGQTQLSAIATGIANVNGGQSLGLVIALVFVMVVSAKSPLPFHQ